MSKHNFQIYDTDTGKILRCCAQCGLTHVLKDTHVGEEVASGGFAQTWHPVFEIDAHRELVNVPGNCEEVSTESPK